MDSRESDEKEIARGAIAHLYRDALESAHSSISTPPIEVWKKGRSRRRARNGLGCGAAGGVAAVALWVAWSGLGPPGMGEMEMPLPAATTAEPTGDPEPGDEQMDNMTIAGNLDRELDGVAGYAGIQSEGPEIILMWAGPVPDKVQERVMELAGRTPVRFDESAAWSLNEMRAFSESFEREELEIVISSFDAYTGEFVIEARPNSPLHTVSNPAVLLGLPAGVEVEVIPIAPEAEPTH